jgi:hypothetical protein
MPGGPVVAWQAKLTTTPRQSPAAFQAPRTPTCGSIPPGGAEDVGIADARVGHRQAAPHPKAAIEGHPFGLSLPCNGLRLDARGVGGGDGGSDPFDDFFEVVGGCDDGLLIGELADEIRLAVELTGEDHSRRSASVGV